MTGMFFKQRVAFALGTAFLLTACGAVLGGNETSSSQMAVTSVAPSPDKSPTALPTSSIDTTPTPTPTPTEATDANAVLPTPISTAGDGNHVIGPTYIRAPELTANPNVGHGAVKHFTMASASSKIYPGLTGSYTRDVYLYEPPGYKAGSTIPFIIVQDGGGWMQLPTVLDNLIAARTVPPMAAILINSGGGDGPGSERGLEYDTVSDVYWQFVQTEVLPFLQQHTGVKFSTDPQARATMGGSSGGAAAFTMAWFHPESYHRVLTYSGTYVDQAQSAAYPDGAWEYPDHLVADANTKPLRIWLEVGQNDNNHDATDGPMHDWVAANEAMAKVLAAKGYYYSFDYALNAGHVDGNVVAQTLPDALRWLWRGYPIP